MNYLTTLLLLGYISMADVKAHSENHPEVECPFGHRHRTGHKHGWNWGFPKIIDSKEEFAKKQEYRRTHHHSGIFGWIKDWAHSDEHKECPFFKHLFQHTLNKESHESPFYGENEIAETENWNPNGVPTAMFHGFGDACIMPGDIQIESMLKKGTGAHIQCIEVGLPMIGGVVNNFETIAKQSCEKIVNNKHFQGEFNVIGFSQGGLLARYIAEECDMPGKVRNLITLGGPHMGVDAVPHCYEGIICDAVNWVVKKVVYWTFVQNWIAPAGYFRDVKNLARFDERSVFLPALNNEGKSRGRFAAVKKTGFEELNAAMLIKFSEDTMIYPKETAWFQQVDTDGKVLPLNATAFYNEDYIGLKKLTEEGKVHYITFEGDHLEFTKDDIEKTIIPFLNQ